MTATLDPPTQLAPGVYDMPADDYHRGPVAFTSLSSSGARKLLPPSCPALFRHAQLNPGPPKKEYDLGHAAHKLVLGAGPELVKIDAAKWLTDKVKAEVLAVRAAGKVPLKPDDYRMVHDMADELRRHRVASALFNPEYGRPEQALIWQDEQSGVTRRALVDWLPNPGPGRMIVADYKTSASADPASIRKSAYAYGYHQQHPWYIDGVETLGLAQDAAFVFVFQEKTAPYLVTVVQLDDDAVQRGRELNRRAINLYAQCVADDHWPGYSTDVVPISLPRWAAYDTSEETL